MRLRLAALALACLLAGPAAGGVWVRGHDGVCREEWTARDVVRGPIAMLNGALRPLTSLTGGVWFAAGCRHGARCLVAGPLWAVGSTFWGLGEGLYWMATGVLDTPMLGVVPLSPYEASRLKFVPTIPFVTSHEPSDDERCPR